MVDQGTAPDMILSFAQAQTSARPERTEQRTHPGSRSAIVLKPSTLRQLLDSITKKINGPASSNALLDGPHNQIESKPAIKAAEA
jgi:hypothetical protein